jgi:hypothetical protein
MRLPSEDKALELYIKVPTDRHRLIGDNRCARGPERNIFIYKNSLPAQV